MVKEIGWLDSTKQNLSTPTSLLVGEADWRLRKRLSSGICFTIRQAGWGRSAAELDSSLPISFTIRTRRMGSSHSNVLYPRALRLLSLTGRRCDGRAPALRRAPRPQRA